MLASKRSVRKRPCLKSKLDGLDKVLVELKEQHSQEQQLQHTLLLKEQVLADLCQLLEGVAQLRRASESTHSHSNCAVAISANGMQHLREDVTTAVGSSAHIKQHSVVADSHLQLVLEAVPAYCCTVDLLSKATPELAALASSLTAADISQLITQCFYEALALLEFNGRRRQHTSPAQQPLAACPAAPPVPDALQQDASAWPLVQHKSALQGLVDRFFGVVTIIMVINVMPLIEATTLNHRTQQQETAPPGHRENELQSLSLTNQQAAYVTAAGQKVAELHKNSLSPLQQLAQQAGSPSLLLLAAQQAETQLERTQNSTAHNSTAHNSTAQLSTGDQSTDQTSPFRSADTRAHPDTPSAPSQAPSAPQEQEAPTGHQVADCLLKEVHLSCQFDHLVLYRVLLSLLVQDCLTATQKAQWLVSSYPWFPGSISLCKNVAQQQLEQASEPQAAGPCTAAEDSPHTQTAQACMVHLQQRRQHWQQLQATAGGGSSLLQLLEAVLHKRTTACPTARDCGRSAC